MPVAVYSEGELSKLRTLYRVMKTKQSSNRPGVSASVASVLYSVTKETTPISVVVFPDTPERRHHWAVARSHFKVVRGAASSARIPGEPATFRLVPPGVGDRVHYTVTRYRTTTDRMRGHLLVLTMVRLADRLECVIFDPNGVPRTGASISQLAAVQSALQSLLARMYHDLGLPVVFATPPPFDDGAGPDYGLALQKVAVGQVDDDEGSSGWCSMFSTYFALSVSSLRGPVQQRAMKMFQRQLRVLFEAACTVSDRLFYGRYNKSEIKGMHPQYRQHPLYDLLPAAWGAGEVSGPVSVSGDAVSVARLDASYNVAGSANHFTRNSAWVSMQNDVGVLLSVGWNANALDPLEALVLRIMVRYSSCTPQVSSTSDEMASSGVLDAEFANVAKAVATSIGAGSLAQLVCTVLGCADDAQALEAERILSDASMTAAATHDAMVILFSGNEHSQPVWKAVDVSSGDAVKAYAEELADSDVFIRLKGAYAAALPDGSDASCNAATLMQACVALATSGETDVWRLAAAGAMTRATTVRYAFDVMYWMFSGVREMRAELMEGSDDLTGETPEKREPTLALALKYVFNLPRTKFQSQRLWAGQPDGSQRPTLRREERAAFVKDYVVPKYLGGNAAKGDDLLAQVSGRPSAPLEETLNDEGLFDTIDAVLDLFGSPPRERGGARADKPSPGRPSESTVMTSGEYDAMQPVRRPDPRHSVTAPGWLQLQADLRSIDHKAPANVMFSRFLASRGLIGRPFSEPELRVMHGGTAKEFVSAVDAFGTPEPLVVYGVSEDDDSFERWVFLNAALPVCSLAADCELPAGTLCLLLHVLPHVGGKVPPVVPVRIMALHMESGKLKFTVMETSETLCVYFPFLPHNKFVRGKKWDDTVECEVSRVPTALSNRIVVGKGKFALIMTPQRAKSAYSFTKGAFEQTSMCLTFPDPLSRVVVTAMTHWFVAYILSVYGVAIAELQDSVRRGPPTGSQTWHFHASDPAHAYLAVYLEILGGSVFRDKYYPRLADNDVGPSQIDQIVFEEPLCSDPEEIKAFKRWAGFTDEEFQALRREVLKYKEGRPENIDYWLAGSRAGFLHSLL